MRAARLAFAGVPQVACFDTAFHAAQPELNRRFALPQPLFDAGVRRYGFHGLSYESILAQLMATDPARAQGRVVIAHLGNGASMCAMRQGRSVATTMSFPPLDGLPMGTRCGRLDAAVVLHLIQQQGRSVDEVQRLLFRESGLLGLSGVSSDMRELEASSVPAAAMAVDYFVEHALRELAGMVAALRGIDTLVFTGGIGEHAAAVRARIVAGAAWLGAADVRVQQPDNWPQFSINVDRIKAAGLGLTEQNVANSVLLGLSGSSQVQPGYWLDPKMGIQYLVNVRATEYAMDSLAQLNALPISAGQTNGGSAQILANLATISRVNVPPVVSHYGVMPVINIYGNVDGRDLGGVLNDMQPLIAKARLNLPRGSSIVVRGQAETMRSSYFNLALGLVGAVVLIYFLLVVNFQNWLDPFIIITALPGALAGVVWGLFLTQTPLSVPALMGAIMSIGVATANSVLVVTFARENLLRGLDPVAAAMEAGVGRIRPVLMTALAMVIGMLPMSLGLGEGGEQNAPLGRAVIGGLVFATVATLFFVPVIFSFLHRNHPPTNSSVTP